MQVNTHYIGIYLSTYIFSMYLKCNFKILTHFPLLTNKIFYEITTN